MSSETGRLIGLEIQVLKRGGKLEMRGIMHYEKGAVTLQPGELVMALVALGYPVDIGPEDLLRRVGCSEPAESGMVN
jgi:hypothetical protein